MMFAASAQLLDRSPVLLAKFNWLPAIVILGLQRCKITVCLPIVGARQGPASETCRDPNASKLGKPRARALESRGKCRKAVRNVGKLLERKPRKALSESCRMPARVRTPSESRCRKAVEISALLGSGRALSCAMCPWQLCLLFGSQAGVRANGQWSQRSIVKGRVCSLVARALIATRRRASMAPHPSAFDSPDTNAR